MPAAFIARQPIFNRNLQVVGYELLFRGHGYTADALIDNPERATATVVLNSFTELELERIVGNKTAWVNVSREFVLDGLVQAIPPRLGGLEISEDEQFDDDMVAALRGLKDQGYRLALDDFRGRPGAEEVLELFDVVKLNMPALGREQLSDQVRRLGPYPGLLLADKLATRPDHEFSAGAGCDLFQGYFFCRPAVVGTRGISANRLALLQVVAALHDPGVDLSDVEQLITRDVALSFRMLRYVNSAYFGLRGDVRSIGQALALLGLENVRRWATLSVLASVDDKPTELTVTALIRARFCELAGEQLRIAGSAELFTLGLFSVIDGMMDAPMRDVVESLPLADDMRDALVLRRGQMGQLLDCVAALEAGDYDSATFVTGAGELYLTALIWANTAAESLFGEPAAAPAPESSSSRAPTVAVLPAAAAGAGLADVDARGPGPGLAFGAGHRKAPGRGARILAACREFLGRLFGGGGDDRDRRESARA
ncbi:MAG TPA: HDOD domain-containing protein [Solirubrobacteraceae bacterium]|jgi:EAL and modified HD-GYP domain-containing signal transduction protein|nr:HDOD domain-containing protein [Solirubrobacteraceae bacterium]